MNHREYRAFQPEVQTWIDRLNAREFRALSSGIGLGRVLPIDRQPSTQAILDASMAGMQRQPISVEPPVRPISSAPVEPAWTAAPIPARAIAPKPRRSGPSQPAVSLQPNMYEPSMYDSPFESSPVAARAASRLGKMIRGCFAHILDLAFVGGSVFSAFFVAAMAFVPEMASNPRENFQHMIPVELQSPLAWALVMGAIYATFIIYWLLFRFLGGATIGQMLLGGSTKSSVAPHAELEQQAARGFSRI